MKTTSLGAVVLTGQGGGGSFSVNVPNVTPGIGPAAGDEFLFPSEQPAATTQAGATQPETYPMTNSATTTPSQYSTIGPVPKG